MWSVEINFTNFLCSGRGLAPAKATEISKDIQPTTHVHKA